MKSTQPESLLQAGLRLKAFAAKPLFFPVPEEAKGGRIQRNGSLMVEILTQWILWPNMPGVGVVRLGLLRSAPWNPACPWEVPGSGSRSPSVERGDNGLLKRPTA